jgi:hypothetical protein
MAFSMKVKGFDCQLAVGMELASEDFLIRIRLSSGIGLEFWICIAKEVWIKIHRFIIV